MVLCEELAGYAETADLFFWRSRGCSAGTEEFGWLVFFQGMSFVVRAYPAVFPADSPVLFRVLYTIFAGIYHIEGCVR